jgi:hypothetical protein
MLLDMWGAVSAQWWADRQAAVGLTGQVADEAPVGIMVSEGGEQAAPEDTGGGGQCQHSGGQRGKQQWGWQEWWWQTKLLQRS